MRDVLELLKKLNISFEILEHEAVYTVEQAERIVTDIAGTGCKNLFLTDGKAYYLYTLEESLRADLKMLRSELGCGALHFAPEARLLDLLGLTPGSVTPLAVCNDEAHQVIVVLDGSLSGKKLLVHPNRNTATVCLAYDDLRRYLVYCGNPVVVL